MGDEAADEAVDEATDPAEEATVEREAQEPGYALYFAHQRKMRGAAEDCQQQGLAFVPLVAESLGGWHDSALAHIRKLGTALALHTGQSDGEASSHLWRLLSILLKKRT